MYFYDKLCSNNYHVGGAYSEHLKIIKSHGIYIYYSSFINGHQYILL